VVISFAPDASSGIWPGLAFLALLQVMALVLNMIPLPPFDGYGVIEPFLSASTRAMFDRTRGYMVFIIFLVLWYVPAANNLFWGLIDSVANMVGIPMNFAFMGYDQFLFWR
jgi:Zn-dependent protease